MAKRTFSAGSSGAKGRPPAAKRKAAGAYHHGDLRRALLDAARAVIDERGASHVTLKGVATAAGVTHAALYHHFSSKTDLLGAVALEGFDGFHQSLVEGRDAAGRDPFERLIGLGIGYLRFATVHAHLFELMFSSEWREQWSKAQLEQGRTKAQPSFVLLLDCVRDVHRALGYPPRDPTPDAMAQWSVVQGASALWRFGEFGPLTLEEVARTVLTRVDPLRQP